MPPLHRSPWASFYCPASSFSRNRRSNCFPFTCALPLLKNARGHSAYLQEIQARGDSERDLTGIGHICKESQWLKHWIYDTLPEGLPRLDVSVSGDPKGTWQIVVELKHQADLSWQQPTVWATKLRLLEDTSGLPIDRGWITPPSRKSSRKCWTLVHPREGK